MLQNIMNWENISLMIVTQKKRIKEMIIIKGKVSKIRRIIIIIKKKVNQYLMLIIKKKDLMGNILYIMIYSLNWKFMIEYQKLTIITIIKTQKIIMQIIRKKKQG